MSSTINADDNRGPFYCGTSNVVLPVPNKSHYPPEFQDKSRLNYYATIFNSVEVNSSFYKIPMERTVERWANDVPDHFRFTFKLWKGITHCKELIYERTDIERFFKAISMSGNKKGALLIQFPGSIKVSYLQKFRRLMDDIRSIDESRKWNLAVEFRDSSWYRDPVYQLIEQYSGVIVTHDMPKSATPYIDMDSKFIYLRFHGERGDYRGSYPDDILLDHATAIKDWTAEGKTVYAYFNNTVGDAVNNATHLSALV